MEPATSTGDTDLRTGAFFLRGAWRGFRSIWSRGPVSLRTTDGAVWSWWLFWWLMYSRLQSSTGFWSGVSKPELNRELALNWQDWWNDRNDWEGTSRCLCTPRCRKRGRGWSTESLKMSQLLWESSNAGLFSMCSTRKCVLFTYRPQGRPREPSFNL